MPAPAMDPEQARIYADAMAAQEELRRRRAQIMTPMTPVLSLERDPETGEMGGKNPWIDAMNIDRTWGTQRHVAVIPHRPGFLTDAEMAQGVPETSPSLPQPRIIDMPHGRHHNPTFIPGVVHPIPEGEVGPQELMITRNARPGSIGAGTAKNPVDTHYTLAEQYGDQSMPTHIAEMLAGELRKRKLLDMHADPVMY